MVETAETLLILEPYDDITTGTRRQTRAATDDHEWEVAGSFGKSSATKVLEWWASTSDGKTYFIKFEKNFIKKHCYTFTKKSKAVYDEVKRLWTALTDAERKTYLWEGYLCSYPPKLYEDAEKNLNTAKFKKQLGHRSVAEQRCVCGHRFNQHAGGGGVCNVGGCGCAAYDSVYGHGRDAKGKPTDNPVAGMPTNTNTVLVMNRIPSDLLLAKIRDGIVAKEKARTALGETWAQGHGGHDLHCEKITLDFGAANKGCILKLTGVGDLDSWTQFQSVPVSIKKQIPVVDVNKPVYSIGHMFGPQAA